jgi:hypothetical protein
MLTLPPLPPLQMLLLHPLQTLQPQMLQPPHNEEEGDQSLLLWGFQSYTLMESHSIFEVI